jgi:hypothetical protein
MSARPALRLVPKPEQEPDPRLEIMICVRDWRQPVGRAGPFRLSMSDFHRLCTAARRLEGGRQ